MGKLPRPSPTIQGSLLTTRDGMTTRPDNQAPVSWGFYQTMAGADDRMPVLEARRSGLSTALQFFASDDGSGNLESCDSRWMGARQRLMRAETLFRGGRKHPNGVVPCTPRSAQVGSFASTAERRLWLTPWLLRGARSGAGPGDCATRAARSWGATCSAACYCSGVGSAFPARRPAWPG
jgi:hypothetical protein